MEHVKIECKDNKLIVEREIDPYLECSTMCVGFHLQDRKCYINRY